MLKHTNLQRLMFLFALAGLFAVAADFACLQDVCAPDEMSSALYTTPEAIRPHQILLLDEALQRSGVSLDASQRARLKADGQLFGIVKLDRPVKHPNGAVEMPRGYLPEIPAGHPWRSKLTPADDAFYSFVEQRILKPNLYDPSNPEQAAAVAAYLTKAQSSDPRFVSWTYADSRTECPRKRNDAPGTMAPDAM
jgi:hypothetical protein